MAKFRKKPVVIEAVQLRWDNWSEMCEHAGVGKLADGKPEGCFVDAKGQVTEDANGRMGLLIPTLEGLMVATQDDWIIRGVKGELYPCKPDIFEATYEPAETHAMTRPLDLPRLRELLAEYDAAVAAGKNTIAKQQRWLARFEAAKSGFFDVAPELLRRAEEWEDLKGALSVIAHEPAPKDEWPARVAREALDRIAKREGGGT